MSKQYLASVAKKCVAEFSSRKQSFDSLVIFQWHGEIQQEFRLKDLPTDPDNKISLYATLADAGQHIGRVANEKSDNLTRLYQAFQGYDRTRGGKPIFVVIELDINEGTHTQQTYDFTLDAQENVTSVMLFEERPIISPRLPLLAAAYFEATGTLEHNKPKIRTFLDASMKPLP